MTLKLRYDTQDEIPESLRDHYAERDGGWQLDVDGDVAGDKLKRALEAERKDRARAFAERDALRKQLEEVQAQREAAKSDSMPKTPPDTEDVKRQLTQQAALFDDRIKAMELHLKQEQERRAASEQKLAESRIEERIRNGALSLGADPKMAEDLVQLPRIRRAFRLDESGEPMVYEGDTPRFSLKDPTKPMPAEEYLALQLKDTPGYFRPTTGAGAVGGLPGPKKAHPVTITVADAADHAKWNRAMARARELGLGGPEIVEQ